MSAVFERCRSIQRFQPAPNSDFCLKEVGERTAGKSLSASSHVRNSVDERSFQVSFISHTLEGKGIILFIHLFFSVIDSFFFFYLLHLSQFSTLQWKPGGFLDGRFKKDGGDLCGF